MNFKDKYEKLIKKLFGTMTDRLTDTFSEDWQTRDVGFVGKLDGRVTELEREMALMRKEIIISDDSLFFPFFYFLHI